MVEVFNLSTGNKEQFELIDLIPFQMPRYTERQIEILSQNNIGMAILKKGRTFYSAYAKKDGGYGGASKLVKE